MALLVLVIALFVLPKEVPAALKNEEVEKKYLGAITGVVKLGMIPLQVELTSSDQVATENVNRMITAQKLRDFIRTSEDTSLGISLDPLCASDLDIELKSIFPAQTNIKDTLSIKNIIVTGLRSIKKQSLTVRINGLRIDFNFTVPSLKIEADIYFGTKSIFFSHVTIRVSHLKVLITTAASVVRGAGKTFFRLSGLQLRPYADPVSIKYSKLLMIPIKTSSTYDNFIETTKKIALKIATKNLFTRFNKILENIDISIIVTALTGAQV